MYCINVRLEQPCFRLSRWYSIGEEVLGGVVKVVSSNATVGETILASIDCMTSITAMLSNYIFYICLEYDLHFISSKPWVICVQKEKKFWLKKCISLEEIITTHHECPCRVEISHLKGRNFNQGRGLPGPWLTSDPEGEISLSSMDRFMMDCFSPTFRGFYPNN